MMGAAISNVSSDRNNKNENNSTVSSFSLSDAVVAVAVTYPWVRRVYSTKRIRHDNKQCTYPLLLLLCVPLLDD